MRTRTARTSISRASPLRVAGRGFVLLGVMALVLAMFIAPATPQGNSPAEECGDADFLVKFDWNETTEDWDVEGDNPSGITLSDVTFDEDGEPVSFDWSETTPTVGTVIVFGGGSAETYGASEQDDLTAPLNPNTPAEGDTFAISHITFCGSEIVPEENDILVEVIKTNDANEDTTYTDSENAGETGDDVSFQVVVTNPTTSEATVVIDSLTDTWMGLSTPIDLLGTGYCPALDGLELDPGESSDPCTFTIEDYAPAEGTALDNTVTVGASELDNPSNTADDTDTSTVSTPVVQGEVIEPEEPEEPALKPEVKGEVIERQPEPAPEVQAEELPRTGSSNLWLAGLGLLLAGGGLLTLARAREMEAVTAER